MPIHVETSSLYKRAPKKRGPRVNVVPTDNEPIALQAIEAIDVVKFPVSGKVFDPAHPSDVVTLSVNGMANRWFAFVNPALFDLIPNEEERIKIRGQFMKDNILGGDMCVPCYKECGDNTYIFKIRLLGHGKGDIRIYAELLETAEDPSKKLVVFTAIDPKAHAKRGKPKRIPLPESYTTSQDSSDHSHLQVGPK